jgi:hypothetical protein
MSHHKAAKAIHDAFAGQCQFATMADVDAFMIREGFTEIDHGRWLADDGLVDAQVTRAADGYHVSYYV